MHNLQALQFLHNMPKAKIGILGGSFDPPHMGHLNIALQALNYYGFDRVIWLLAKQNPLKSRIVSPMQLRAQQASLFATHPKIIISTFEENLSVHTSYIVLQQLTQIFAHVNFTWLMGIDNVQHFINWEHWQGITELVRIIIFDRPTKERLISDLPIFYQTLLAKNKTNNIIVHRGRLYNISSTNIRKNLIKN